ncbi:MAG: G8 domain-containing protein [Pirellulales bacterium]
MVRADHKVLYDVESQDVIRLVQVAGTLEFAADRNTRLEVGLLTVIPSETPTEEGFDCHAPAPAVDETKPRPSLFVGRPGADSRQTHGDDPTALCRRDEQRILPGDSLLRGTHGTARRAYAADVGQTEEGSGGRSRRVSR